MKFRVLGGLEVIEAGAPIPIRGRICQYLLALLVSRSGRAVSMSALVDGIWDSTPPPTASRQVRNAVSRLRRSLGAERVATAGDGYRIRLDGVDCDVVGFETMVREGIRLAETGDASAAARHLEAGLERWRGRAYAGLPGRVLDADAARLDELRLVGLETRIDGDIAAGRAAAVVAELRRLSARHPYRQRLTGLLMRALDQVGATAEALDVFEGLRSRLADDLGLEPDRLVVEVREAMGRGRVDAPGSTTRADVTTTPAQLPPGPAELVGRAEHYATFDRIVSAADPTTVGIVSGAAGVGKTALAVSWAHRVRKRYPDGQLFVNLRGFDRAEPVDPLNALGRFIRSLRHPDAAVPSDLGEAAAEYRALLAGKRILVLLDNAAATEQVRPLLPDTDTCAVIVTSRDDLTDLVPQVDPVRLAVAPLSRRAAVDLLRGVVGDGRIGRDTAMADRLVRLCGRLPLALRISAAQLLDEPDRQLGDHVAELENSRRLDVLAIDGDPDAAVSAAIGMSVRSLEPEAEELFLRLGCVPGEDVSLALAVTIADGAEPTVAASLERLRSVHLLESTEPRRYRFHDLVRDYAASLARAKLPTRTRSSVSDAFIDWHFDARLEARPAEEANILAAFPALEAHPRLWRLAPPLMHAFNAGRWHAGLREAIEAGVASADRHDDDLGRFRTTYLLANYLLAVDERSAAIETCRRSIALAAKVGTADLVVARGNLGVMLYNNGEYAEAEVQLRSALAGTPTTVAWQRLFHQRLNLGLVVAKLGRYDEAVTIYTRLARQLREEDSPQRSNWLGYAQAMVDLHRGRWEAALAGFDRVVVCAADISDRRWEAHARVGRGKVLRRRRQLERADTELRHALDLARRMERPAVECDVIAELVALNIDAGRPDRATRWWETLADNRFGDLSPVSRGLIEFTGGLVHNGDGDFRRAMAHAQRAVELHARGPDPLALGRALVVLGDAHAGLGQDATADTVRRRALDIFTGIGVPEADDLRRRLDAEPTG